MIVSPMRTPRARSSRFAALRIAALLGIASLSTAAAAQFAASDGGLSAEQLARANAQAQLGSALQRVATNGNDGFALAQAGRAALALGDARAALGFLGRAEQLLPRDAGIKAALGAAMVQLEDPTAALRYFDQAAALGGIERLYLGDRGLAYDLLGDQRRAQGDYAVAMQSAPSAELTRRYALSLGISGQSDAAVQMLAPLLRAQDRAAWRSRAMILAMNGRPEEARQIARTTMPSELAQGLDPYFALMDRLTPPQLAAASHFGRFPNYDVLRAQPSRAEAVRMASATSAATPARTAAASSSRDRSRSRSSSRVSAADRFEASRGTARERSVATATPSPSPAAAPTPAPAPAPVRVAVASPPPIPAPSYAAPVASPRVSVTPRPAPEPIAPAASSPTAAPGRLLEPAPSPSVAPAPVRVAALPPSSVPSASPSATFALPPAQPPAPAPVATAIPAPTVAAVVPPPSVQPAAPTANTTVVAGWNLGDVVNSLTVTAEEQARGSHGLTAAELQGIADDRRRQQQAEAAERRRRQQAEAAANRARAAEAERARVAEAEAARERAEAEAKAREEAENRRRHPARTWVQIATGNDAARLASDCARLRREHSAAWDGQSCATAEWGRTRRLVVGPFRNAAAARTWERAYKAAGGNAFVWNSGVGEEVTPVGRR